MWRDEIANKCEEKSKKNVLVFYCHNSSASYLAQQPLLDKWGMAPNLDSWDNQTNSLCLNNFKLLSSPDGIQFWHFKNRTGTTADACGSIYPCVDAMEKYINERGEKLDAIVLVSGLDKDCQNEEGIQWLKEMKRRFSGVKVLTYDFIPYLKTLGDLQQEKGANPDYPANVIRSTFAFPLDAKAIIDNRAKEADIKQGDPNYVLAEPIDRMIVNGRFTKQVNQLREFISMPPYQAIGHSGV